MANEELSAALRQARQDRRLSIRAMAKAAGLSTTTIMRLESSPEEIRAESLDRATDALGLPRAVRVSGTSGDWMIPDTSAGTITHGAQESQSVVTDGTNVLTLRFPDGFLDQIPEDERADFEKDALLTVMQLARAVERASRDTRTTTPGE